MSKEKTLTAVPKNTQAVLASKQRQAALQHLREGKLTDAQIMRATLITPQELVQLKERLRKAGELPQESGTVKQQVQPAKPETQAVAQPKEAATPTPAAPSVPEEPEQEASEQPELHTLPDLPVWNTHTCEEMPRDCRVVREAYGEANIITNNLLCIGPINVCPWCAANL